MKKYSITKKAFRMYHSYHPKYFPLKFLQIIFENVSPYFNLWMSAEIITALYEGRDRRELYTLVAITLFGNFVISVIGAFLKRTVAAQFQILENAKAAAFNSKMLSLDYDKIESPEIRQHRRKILENSWVNGYGTSYMREQIQLLMKCFVNIAFSAVLFIEMVSLIAVVGFQLIGFVLFAAMMICIILQVLCNSWSLRKITLWNKDIGDLMLDENRIDAGYHPAGMDNRIYCQQNIISRFNEKSARQHLEVFSSCSNKQFVCAVPTYLFYGLSEICSFLLIKEVQDKVGYGCYDIVVANILADVLVPLTPVVVNHMKPGGIYITSGIISEKEETVTEAVKAAGLKVLEVTRQGEWVSVTARKE